MLLLSGSLHSVLTAIFMILEKVSRDSLAGKGKGVGPSMKRSEHEDEVRALMGGPTCGEAGWCGCEAED